MTNITEGGTGLLNPSDEVRDKIRKATIAQFSDPVFKEKFKKIIKERNKTRTNFKHTGLCGEDNPMYDVHRHGEDHPTFGMKFLGRGNASFIVSGSTNVYYVHTGLLNRFGEEFNIGHKVLRRCAKKYEETGKITHPRQWVKQWTAIYGDNRLCDILEDNQQPISIIEYYAEGSKTKTRVCTPKWEEIGDTFFHKENDIFQSTNRDGSVKTDNTNYLRRRDLIQSRRKQRREEGKDIVSSCR